MTTPDDGSLTRDLGTLPEDGPQATQFESSTARQTEAPGTINAGGQAEAVSERPQFSPVGQPGMISEIHWHEVRSPPEQQPQPTQGMISRLAAAPMKATVVVNQRRRRRRGGKPKPKPKPS